MGLTLTTRQFHPYFLSHTIMMLTDTPFRRILNHPEAMRRLIKWATKMSKYDIEYQSHPTIKAQILGDCLVETM